MTLKSEQERVTLCCAFVIRVGDKHFAALTEEPRLGTDRRQQQVPQKFAFCAWSSSLSLQTCLHLSEAKAIKMR